MYWNIIHKFATYFKLDIIMNKFYLLLAIALPLVFISCGDDKDEPGIASGFYFLR